MTTKKADQDIVNVNVRRIPVIVGILSVALSVIGSVLGTGIVVGSVQAKLAAAEQQIQEHAKANEDQFRRTDVRLQAADERWNDIQKKMTVVSEDVAVMKAILPRLESGIKDVQAELRQRLPAINPGDGKTQQGQK